MNRRFVVLLCFLAVCAYSNALHNGFVAGDRQFVLNNPAIGDARAALQSFASDYWGALGGSAFVYYRPLIILTHFIDYRLYGLNPTGHHLTNLILHLTATLLVFRFFCCLLPSASGAAFAGAALFALHPIHTHSVSYVMGRTDLLPANLMLLALVLLAVPRPGRRRVAAACICFFLALLSKEIAAPLPAVFLLYRLLWLKDRSRRGTLVPFACLCVSFVLYGVMRTWAVGLSVPAGVSPEWYTPLQRVGLVFITGGFYVWKLLLPVRLCYYSNLTVPIGPAETMLNFFFLLGLGFAAVSLLAAFVRPRAGFALCWIGCCLLPVLNIIPMPFLAKENYLYIPSVGFCLLFSLALAGQPERIAKRLALLLTILGILYGSAALNRNRDYRDPVLFLHRTIEAMAPIAPGRRGDVRLFEGVKNYYTSYRNLGRLYRERRQWTRAAEAFRRALAYVTDYFPPEYRADILVSLGGAEGRAGRPAEATRHLQAALPLSSTPWTVYNLLGVAAASDQAPDEAESFFKEAIRLRSGYAPAHYNLGMLYLQMNRLEAAREFLGRAVSLDPGYREKLPDLEGAPAVPLPPVNRSETP